MHPTLQDTSQTHLKTEYKESTPKKGKSSHHSFNYRPLSMHSYQKQLMRQRLTRHIDNTRKKAVFTVIINMASNKTEELLKQYRLPSKLLL